MVVNRSTPASFDPIGISRHMVERGLEIIVFTVRVQFAFQRAGGGMETRRRAATRHTTMVPLSRQISRRLQRFTKLIPRCN